MNTEQTTSTTRRGGVLARLRSRGSERGSVMVETLVFMGVIGVVMTGYTGAQAAVNHSQRSTQAHDVASQIAHGVLEQAKSTRWARLGFRTEDYGYGALPDAGSQVICTGLVPIPTQPGGSDPRYERVLPEMTRTADGITVTLRVSIVQVEGPDTDECRGYGTKKITVRASWQPPGSGDTETAVFSASRTPKPFEVAPSDITEVTPCATC